MRILMLITGMTTGGAERVMATLCNSLSANNEVRLAIIKNLSSDYIIGNDTEIVAGNVTRQNFIKSVSFVRKQLITYNPNVVLSFMTKTNIVVLTARLFMKKKIPVVISERNSPYKAKLIYKLIRRILYPFSQGAVFQTKQALEYYKKILRGKYTIIRNPINPDFYLPRFTREYAKKIVAVGRLYPEKNQKLLIDAFKLVADKYQEYTVEFYGDGPEHDTINKYIQDMGLSDRVKLMGRKNHIEELIYNAELFVLSSDSEGMPNALLEAMALGLACISTNCPIGGPGEIIDNNNNGILVPVRDARAMANAIDDLLSNKEKVVKIRINARKVLADYNTDTVCGEWEKFLYAVANDANKNVINK